VGGVQGLGVRPAIFRLATDLGLGGVVHNTPRGVEIEIEGRPGKLDEFEKKLPTILPAAACLVQVSSAPVSPNGQTAFAIVKEPIDAPLPARPRQYRAVCEGCLGELRRADGRR